VKCAFLPLLFAVFLIASSASALDTQTRPVGPVMSWSAGDLGRFDPAWLHVKFVEGSNVLIEQGRFVDDTGLDLSAVNAEFGRSTTLLIKPTFDTPRAVARTWKDLGELRTNCTGPDLSLWFNIQVTGGPAEVARMVNAMNASAAVEIAHPVPIVELARIHPGSDHGVAPVTQGDRTDDFTADQVYLYDAPVGLDAPAAWSRTGGKGLGMKFIDVELAWTEDHEDFTTEVFHIGGASQNELYEAHGTAVLGEIQGQHNGFGIDGFAPDIQFGVVAVDIYEWPEVPHRFQEAVDNLDPGDVWLIELQMYPPDRDATPMEWLQVNYDVIWTSSWSLGIVCVEAGANGSQNLDAASWNGIFDRQFRDSGAIMVAAGTPYTRQAEYFTNYGSRMDVNAWGSEIVTTGYGDLYNGGSLQTLYTSQFGGTSGASPMVAGAALCLQGIATEELDGPLSPVDLRQLLCQTGTPHQDPAKEIGPRPHLGPAITEMLDVTTSAPIAITRDRLTITGSPNPFASRSEINFRLPSAGPVTIEVFDAAGRLVRVLVNENMSSGAQHVTWDGKNDAGQSVGSGVYLMRLQSNEQVMSGKVWLVR